MRRLDASPARPQAGADRRKRSVRPRNTPACGSIKLTAVVDALLDGAAPMPGPEALVQAVASVKGSSAATVKQLLDVVDRLCERAQQLDDTAPQRPQLEALEQHGNFAVIKALQRTAAARPQVLAAAYSPARSVPALDVLCEAASSAPAGHPALFDLQVQHLSRNASVAALSLANSGDPAGREAIVAQLKTELGHWQADGAAAPRARLDMGTLHIEGMLEALEAFDEPPPPQLLAQAKAVVRKTRGTVGALYGLLHEGAQPAKL